MKIPVLVEQTSEQRFVATGSAPFGVSAEAETREEAVAKLKELIEARVSQGAEITAVEVPDQCNPWLEGAGMFHDDPLFGEWQEAVAEYRRMANKSVETP